MSVKAVCPMCGSNIVKSDDEFTCKCKVCGHEFVPSFNECMPEEQKFNFKSFFKPDEFTFIKWTQIICICFLINLFPFVLNRNRLATSICVGLIALIILSFWEGLKIIYDKINK